LLSVDYYNIPTPNHNKDVFIDVLKPTLI